MNELASLLHTLSEADQLVHSFANPTGVNQWTRDAMQSTDAANRTGTSVSHGHAQAAHRAAANSYQQVGNAKMAKFHNDAADKHMQSGYNLKLKGM
jgi:hypothetical protein